MRPNGQSMIVDCLSLSRSLSLSRARSLFFFAAACMRPDWTSNTILNTTAATSRIGLPDGLQF
eukprot:SAG22_NODE_349_length_11854_cov_8.087282_14_plen_63_part_00